MTDRTQELESLLGRFYHYEGSSGDCGIYRRIGGLCDCGVERARQGVRDLFAVVMATPDPSWIEGSDGYIRAPLENQGTLRG